MRLVTLGRIERAFPELDRFPPEKCAKFLRAARRSWRYRIAPVTVGALLFLLLPALGWLGVEWLAGSRDPHSTLIGQDPALLLAGAGIGALLAAALTLLARDRLLLRRLRYILRARGVCAQCRYGLVGLPVSPACVVTCPECGLEAHVDPALGELASDGSGGVHFRPIAHHVPTTRLGRWIRRHRVGVRRGLIASGVAILVLPGAGWGFHEWRLARQAALARSERPGPAGVLAFIEAGQPPRVLAPGEGLDDPDLSNAWVRFDALQAKTAAIDAEIRASVNSSAPDDPVYFIDFGAIFQPLVMPEDLDAEEREKRAGGHARSIALARRCLDAYRGAGVFEELDLMAACPRAVRSIDVAPSQPMVLATIMQVTSARQYARVNAARMELAVQARDVPEFSRALESTLALVRMCRTQAFLIDGLVGNAIELLALDRCRGALVRAPEDFKPAIADAIARAFDRQPLGPGPAHMFAGERLAMLDTICWIFSEPSNVRWGRFSASVRAMLGGESPSAGIGTYRANRDTINRVIDSSIERAAVQRWGRTATPLPDLGGLALLELLLPALHVALESCDLADLHRQAIRVMVAIERFRAARGEYPDSLGDLAPDFLPEPPVDPWTGTPLGYRRIDPAADPFQRHYLLYSFGDDRADNGGVFADRDRFSSHKPSALPPGTDFELNRP